jgi:hypothetical protein
MYRILLIASLFGLISACSIPSSKIDRSEETYHPQTAEDRRENDMQSLLTKSDEPLVIYSSNKKKSGGGGGGGESSGIAGSYLWRAALESIAFMPLNSVDSNGGVIITDWYRAPDSHNEKLKFSIFILNPDLQISSIKVTAFRQVENLGHWRPATVNKELSRVIEDNILRKAIALKAQASEK